jgi:hypothetical protein
MADLTVSEVRLIEKGELYTAPTAETLAVGDVARNDASALLTGANATGTTENNWEGVVLDVDAGPVVTVAGNDCLVTLGTALAALAYGDLVYLSDTDKKLADAAGTVSTIVGRVEAVRNQGTVYKALRIKKEVS